MYKTRLVLNLVEQETLLSALFQLGLNFGFGDHSDLQPILPVSVISYVLCRHASTF